MISQLINWTTLQTVLVFESLKIVVKWFLQMFFECDCVKTFETHTPICRSRRQ